MITEKDKLKILNRILIKFEDVFNSIEYTAALKIEKKADSSIVTDVDHFISKEVKRILKPMMKEKGLSFYSEEDMESFSFPMVILDPIDGTRELSQGLGECVLSLSIMQSPTEGYGWLFNPFTGFSIASNDRFIIAPNFQKMSLTGLVSRSEHKKGVFSDIHKEGINLVPRGSIAFKLGLLASGACDFVYSKSPKNIWDIAAGTFICRSRGLRMYQKGLEVVSMASERIDGELIWCRPEQLEYITSRLYK